MTFRQGICSGLRDADAMTVDPQRDIFASAGDGPYTEAWLYRELPA
jgi:hypothetical protein